MSYYTNLVRAKFIAIHNAVEELKETPLSIRELIEHLDLIHTLVQEGLERLRQEEEGEFK